MMSYGQSARCRWAILLEYFNTTGQPPGCGTCDNCVNSVQQVLAG